MANDFEFTDSERAFLREMRAIERDSLGREVLVGLTMEETVFYVTYGRNRLVGTDRREDGGKYLELHGKHELVRHSVLSAERDLRDERPQRH